MSRADTSFYNHTIADTVYYTNTRDVAVELVMQRLLQNYQLLSKSPPDANRWVLVMGNRVHEIWYHPGTDDPTVYIKVRVAVHLYYGMM